MGHPLLEKHTNFPCSFGLRTGNRWYSWDLETGSFNKSCYNENNSAFFPLLHTIFLPNIQRRQSYKQWSSEKHSISFKNKQTYNKTKQTKHLQAMFESQYKRIISKMRSIKKWIDSNSDHSQEGSHWLTNSPCFTSCHFEAYSITFQLVSS